MQICRNGLTITRDASRSVHHGERLGEGVVAWSGNTLDKTLALITARTTDAVSTFVEPRYVSQVVRAIGAQAGHPIQDPQEAVAVVSQRLRFTDAQQADMTRLAGQSAASRPRTPPSSSARSHPDLGSESKSPPASQPRPTT